MSCHFLCVINYIFSISFHTFMGLWQLSNFAPLNCAHLSEKEKWNSYTPTNRETLIHPWFQTNRRSVEVPEIPKKSTQDLAKSRIEKIKSVPYIFPVLLLVTSIQLLLCPGPEHLGKLINASPLQSENIMLIFPF